MRLHLIGTFQLRDATGCDRSPRGLKARALIALVCTASDRRRTRRWLEARLWSDRGADQASGSLRQTLYEIRQALGPHAGLLMADRDTVSLDGITTDIEADPAGTARALAAGREFLEGIDIRDEAFEDWLTAERGRLAPSGPDQPVPRARPGALREGEQGRRIPFLVQVNDLGEEPAAFLPVALASEISRLIGDLAEVEVYHVAPGRSAVVAPVRGLRLTIEAAPFGNALHLVATIANIAQRRIAWTRRAQFSRNPAAAVESGDFARLTFEAAEAAHAALSLAVEPDSETWAQGRQAQAVRAMFTFDHEQLLRADRLLKESLDVAPSAQAWAWRAFLRQTMVIERVLTDFDAARDDAERFARMALAFPGRSSIVLALVSQISAMLALDADAAFATAEEAAQINAFNPYAQYALAAAHLRAGRFDLATRHGRMAADIAATAHNAFFFQGFAALIALAAGDIDRCIRIYEAVSFRAPHFRPPLRGLAVLSLVRDDHARATRYAALLAKAEPGFTLDTLLRDDRYPAVTLRQMGLLNTAGQRL
ncbi:MAG: hypothetical protein QM656_06010 [Paracoccaceae bacterium]